MDININIKLSVPDRLIRFFKKLSFIGSKKFIILTLLITGTILLYGDTPPYSFSSGQAISSAQFNEMFTALYATKWSDGGSGTIYYNGGNVGIGTNSPAAKLDLSSTGGSTVFRIANATDAGDISMDSGTMRFRTMNSEPIVFHPGDAGEKMRILENGSVGIGTDSPNAKLHVNGNAYFAEGVGIYTNPSSDAALFIGSKPLKLSPCSACMGNCSASGDKGKIYYDINDNHLYVCTGSGGWKQLDN